MLFETSKDFGRCLLFNLCDPPLRSVALDTKAIEIQAAGLLDQLMSRASLSIRGPLANSIVVSPRGIVTRGMPDTLPIDDSLIASVVGHIRTCIRRDCSHRRVSSVSFVTPYS
ncbi:MAG: hypothetical protein OSA98_10860 [Rubripirellula sp.]|nr:hypothetical protein [Rubripirellula sp.]